MKTNLSKKQLRIGTLVALFITAAALMAFSGSNGKSNYVAHEWGTFTSVQGADGVLLNWRPLETSLLPSFVYDWSKPGLNRTLAGFGKGAMTSLQRMETPVVYFYADEELSVDVSVQFPQGRITEWFPQADLIGPAWVATPPFVETLDTGAHKLGAKLEFTFASLLSQHVAKDSRVVWSGVKILPGKQHPEIAPLVPSDKSGSHYFAARETDSTFVKIKSLSKTNSSPEYDKFLFYRGVGNFTTPLQVTMASDNNVTLTNQGAEALSGLFVIRLRNGEGQFIHIDKLDQNGSSSVSFEQDHPASEVIAALEKEIVSALTEQGLYPREATAMVNTWKDSWFEEDGVRVLYLLSREWTDRTLPMQLSPQPQQLARVMVGRAELIPPGVQELLCKSLKDASTGDTQARKIALLELKRLGRFAEASMGLVRDTESKQTGWSLLQVISKAKSEQVASRLQNAVVKSN